MSNEPLEISGLKVVAKGMRKAPTYKRQSICPVWAMLKGNVEIVTEYRIVKKAESEGVVAE